MKPQAKEINFNFAMNRQKDWTKYIPCLLIVMFITENPLSVLETVWGKQ